MKSIAHRTRPSNFLGLRGGGAGLVRLIEDIRRVGARETSVRPPLPGRLVLCRQPFLRIAGLQRRPGRAEGPDRLGPRATSTRWFKQPGEELGRRESAAAPGVFTQPSGYFGGGTRTADEVSLCEVHAYLSA